jgi:membrane protein involved in colicin uptake
VTNEEPSRSLTPEQQEGQEFLDELKASFGWQSAGSLMPEWEVQRRAEEHRKAEAAKQAEADARVKAEVAQLRKERDEAAEKLERFGRR